MNLSPHYTKADLERSGFATRHDIDNTIPPDQIETWRTGLHVLVEPLASRFPGLWISSGFRCEDLNRRLGGSNNSQHRGLFWMKHRSPSKYVPCAAFDLELPRADGGNGKLWDEIARANLPFDQLIWEFGTDQEPDWIHISHVPHESNRRDVLKSERKKDALQNRKTVYTRIELVCAAEKRLANMISDTPPFRPGQTYAGGSANA